MLLRKLSYVSSPELIYQEGVAPELSSVFSLEQNYQETIHPELTYVFSPELNYPEGVATELSHVFFSGTELSGRRCSGTELRFFLRN